MKITNNIIGNILGKSRARGGKNDWDGDGVLNRKDCQPRNTMRQDPWPPTAWPKKLLEAIYYLKSSRIPYRTIKKPTHYILEINGDENSKAVINHISRLADNIKNAYGLPMKKNSYELDKNPAHRTYGEEFIFYR